MGPIDTGEDLFDVLAQADEVVNISKLGDFASGFGAQPDGVVVVLQLFDYLFDVVFDFVVDGCGRVFHIIGHVIADAPGAGLVGSL